MKEKILFQMKSPYRSDFKIRGFYFGSGAKTAAIVGPLRGDEIQQLYISSQLVKTMAVLESEGRINKGSEILVVPCANHFSANLERRFWAMDNTDINRMFPGYSQGETTQRIAAGLFEALKNYAYGIQLASYYMPGDFIPHVRMMKTGYECVEEAMFFELPYVYLHDIKPYDTAILNYNWQVWNTKAFSVYAGHTNNIDKASANRTVESILRFLSRVGAINLKVGNIYNSTLITDADQVELRSPQAGIFDYLKDAGATVEKGEKLAAIIDPYSGLELASIISPVDGTIFFMHKKPLALEKTALFKIIKTRESPIESGGSRKKAKKR